MARSWEEAAAKSPSMFSSVAHSWKMFSTMRHRVPRSGLATSAVTVAYALGALCLADLALGDELVALSVIKQASELFEKSEDQSLS